MTTTTEGTLTALLEAAAHAHPGAPAVSDRNGTLDYAELDDTADRVAHALTASGPLRGARVAIWLNKSVEAVAAIHAVLRTGAAYVPLDPTAPPLRAATVLADCGAEWLVTTPDRAEALRARAPEQAARLSVLHVGPDSVPTSAPAPAPGRTVTTWAEALRRHAGAGPVRTAVAPGDTAYLLYTSGSTGTPKGVALTHANARAFVDWAVTEFELTPADVLASHAPLHFDLSILDLFAAAACAGRVALVPESLQGMGAALLRFVAEQDVSVWYSVPTALRRMAEAADTPAAGRLRVVAFAGEEYPTRHLRNLAAVLPDGAALYNLYGPTETNVCTHHRLGPEDLAEDAPAAPPIGRPCPYADTFLLGPDGSALPDTGEATGELCVAGPSVTAGYWNDPARTAAVTVERDGRRHHRTGDRVRRLPDGRLLFLGREDTMVKLKGHRIELGEIEAVLDGHPEIAEAICVTTPGPDGTGRLTAFATAVPDTAPEERSLRRHCRDHLPGYMVPERIVLLPALPYTSTGKVDRGSLTARAAAGTDDPRPGSPAALRPDAVAAR
ncbi:amino acid adenylation domain-containing protein [Streptomyces sp. NPDC097619]|uniref:amino acid adenylation domain-containing protein n=1 Tax=Streptomyces sp. NPDC097619 TaxID=3157228 RepID=UPI00331FB940